MLSLAVKYRPKSFKEVIGQSNILKILTNQIQRSEVKQGYCFVGSAGTGKTTVARIFAEAMNSDMIGFNKPIGETIEMDAASNNGVDNIRDLRETCKFKPILGGRKVYIIDEVHMLSNGAFNALLKILEEPPAHVVFILCTTDPQKIPATILSRVQRFDFTRVDPSLVVHRLEHILLKESIVTYEKEALEYIAKLTGGGVRDAISVTDTCLSYGELTLARVHEVLGIVALEDYFSLLAAFGKEEVISKVDIVLIMEGIHNEGKDLKVFIRGFMDFIVDVLKYKTTADLDYTNFTGQYLADLDKVAQSREELLKIFKEMCELNKYIFYDARPKAIIQGWLLSL